jgi:hypothetical protein
MEFLLDRMRDTRSNEAFLRLDEALNPREAG